MVLYRVKNLFQAMKHLTKTIHWCTHLVELIHFIFMLINIH